MMMMTKLELSAERRKLAIKGHIDPLLHELGEEISGAASPEEVKVLRSARVALSAVAREFTPERARASARSMRDVAALWPQSRAYDGAVEYLESLAA